MAFWTYCNVAKTNSSSSCTKKLLSPEKFASDVLLSVYPFIDQEELLSGFPPLY